MGGHEKVFESSHHHIARFPCAAVFAGKPHAGDRRDGQCGQNQYQAGDLYDFKRPLFHIRQPRRVQHDARNEPGDFAGRGFRVFLTVAMAEDFAANLFRQKTALPKVGAGDGRGSPRRHPQARGDCASIYRRSHGGGAGTFARPFIGVVTAVAPVHLEAGQFKDIHAIAKEKGELVAHLPKEGVAIVNDDDPLVRGMPTTGRRMTYGTQPSAEVWASEVAATSRQLRFTAHHKNQSAAFDVPVLGVFQLYVLLPAIAVGVSLGLTLEQCAKALFQFRLPPGRMTPIDGINKSHLIDSSYNASPVSMTAALEFLASLKAERKIAALGTMNELGETSREAHIALGKQAAHAATMLIAVGPEAATIKKGALEAGLPENQIYTFFDSEEAGHFLKKELQPKDVVLVKGSQNRVRMERLIKVIMAHPEQAHTLLCRQDKEWEKI